MPPHQRQVIFRWASWNPTAESCFLLSHSIGSFRKFFGASAEYLVYADDVAFVRSHLLAEAQVREIAGPGPERSRYDRDGATWRKWAPEPRTDIDSTEFRVDADIFLLKEPVELRDFLAESTAHYLVSSEEFTALWPYGNFAAKLGQRFIPINAGFVGQAPGADLTALLDEELAWWENGINEGEIKYHDEQGAVAVIINRLAAQRSVAVLDPARYRVVCPLNEPPVEDLSGLIMMHAAYPRHPAFWRFLPEIARISGVTPDPAQAGVKMEERTG